MVNDLNLVRPLNFDDATNDDTIKYRVTASLVCFKDYSSHDLSGIRSKLILLLLLRLLLLQPLYQSRSLRQELHPGTQQEYTMTQRQIKNNPKLRTVIVIATIFIFGQVSQAQLTFTPLNGLFGGPSASSSAGASASASASASSGGGSQPVINQRPPSLPGQRDSSPEALEILKARGFIGELYTILSRDKTPLSIYHIINPYADQRTLNRYPVLVFHGVAADGAQMVAHSERTHARPPVPGKIVSDPGDTSLALMLANNNFDVFLVDARGTNLNNHLVSQDIDPVESQKYWNFSLDEQIHYDLPAIIDFILEQTRAEKLHYIGFSESTFFMFAFLTRFPEYQNKLASFVALAPVAYVGHIGGLALSLFTLVGFVPETINANFMPQPISDTVGVGIRRVCNNPALMKSICAFFATSVAGLGDDEHSRDFYATLMKSTSIKAVKHFLQLVHQKRFGMYDYGPVANMRHYGTIVPPNYDLSKIKLPTIVLFRGATDFLSNPTDQQLLLQQLGTKPYRDYNYPNYNHIDFLTGRHIVADINLPATNVMFELLKWNAAQSSGSKSIFKDPRTVDLPKPYKPVVVARPDGTQSIRFKSNLINNLANGIIETNNAKLKPLAGLGGSIGLTAMIPASTAILKQQWDLWQNIDDKVQNLGSDINLPELKLQTLQSPLKLPQLPQLAQLPKFPQLPQLSQLPQLTQLPQLMQLPGLG